MGVGTRPTVSGQMSGSRATASEPPVHACPRCRAEVPVGVLYGPCAACRAALGADAEATFARKLERVAAALADGWAWDDGEAGWVRDGEVRR